MDKQDKPVPEVETNKGSMLRTDAGTPSSWSKLRYWWLYIIDLLAPILRFAFAVIAIFVVYRVLNPHLETVWRPTTGLKATYVLESQCMAQTDAHCGPGVELLWGWGYDGAVPAVVQASRRRLTPCPCSSPSPPPRRACNLRHRCDC